MIMTQSDCNGSLHTRAASNFTASLEPEQPPRIFFHPDPGLVPSLQPGLLTILTIHVSMTHYSTCLLMVILVNAT